MGTLAERPGREMARAATSESLAQHLRHWLRDRLVVWFSVLLKGSRKIYDGPCPDEADSEDSPRARRDPMRREASAEVAAVASGAPPPKKRSKAWLLLGLCFMFLFGLGSAGSAVWWYFESTMEANDRLAAAALKEAKAAEKKITDAQRALSGLKEDLATMKLQRQSDQARINQLVILLKNRGTPVPAAPAPTAADAPAASAGSPGPGSQAQLRAMSAANDGGCTLTGPSAGTQFKECVAAMNAGQR